MPLLTPPDVGVSPEALLAVAYADTRAGELSYALDLPVQTALRTLRLDLAGMDLDLRILGYSHQVVITGGSGAPLLTETVARLPSSGGRALGAPLPRAHEERRTTGRGTSLRYAMSTVIAPLGEPAAIAAAMRELDAADHAVLGVFPGHPHAFTGLRAGAVASGSVEWHSWHAYPGSDELVQTHSRLDRISP